MLGLFGAGVLGVLRLGADLSPPAALEPLQRGQSVQHAGRIYDALLGNLSHPLGTLLLQLVVVMLAARGMGKVFRKLGQPSVIGEVTAGILLGPSLLGWLFPTAQSFLFPASSMETLGLLSQVGVILFMFVVGAGLDLGHLKENARTAVVVSQASIIVPFFLGTALALVIFPVLASAEASFTAFALFLGVAMSITAFPVLARIVAERGLSKTAVGRTAIACAAVADVTAWCLLAVVVAIANAAGMASAIVTISLTLIFILFMLFVVRPQMERLLSPRPGEGRIGRVSALLAFVFASALCTETIGIHPLFGAFLAGVVIPSNQMVRTFVKLRLETVVTVILLPLFFAFTGLRTQIGLLSDWQSVSLCLAIIGVAIAGKFGGSTAAARWAGMNWHDAVSVGALMNTRGLIELIVLNIGYDLGILSPRIFTMIVLMALVTTFMAGPILTLLERLKQRVRVPALEPVQSPTST